QYGEEWVRKFTLFMQFLKSIAMLIAGFIVVSVLFIISNTIKLTIFARKDEIEILGLVGATRLFIKTPFIIEGVIQGLTGAVLALAILAGAFYILLSTSINFLSIKGGVSSLQFLPIEYILFIIAAGIILGFIGSITSLKRFINI
ncbi:MAG: ABC transporter permease, partial [Desulfuromonadales bacterium]|nr:ABC transporter permease [Desulfuromonadales bacterium]